MRELHGFSVPVEREDLLTKLKAHREQHIVDLRDALKGYQVALQEEAEKLIMRLDACETDEDLENLHHDELIGLRKPQSLLPVFDDLIGMLEATRTLEIEVTHSRYKQWYKGEFPEIEHFLAANAVYLGHSRAVG